MAVKDNTITAADTCAALDVRMTAWMRWPELLIRAWMLLHGIPDIFRPLSRLFCPRIRGPRLPPVSYLTFAR
jgi:hypothetical protein